MGKKERFIEMVEMLINSAVLADGEALDSEALAYFEALKDSKETSAKPQFTDNGKLILKYMKDNETAKNNLFKAKDIAEGIFASGRSVSGSIRKLVTDGYVEKVGQDPIIYALTTIGKEISIE